MSEPTPEPPMGEPAPDPIKGEPAPEPPKEEPAPEPVNAEPAPDPPNEEPTPEPALAPAEPEKPKEESVTAPEPEAMDVGEPKTPEPAPAPEQQAVIPKEEPKPRSPSPHPKIEEPATRRSPSPKPKIKEPKSRSPSPRPKSPKTIMPRPTSPKVSVSKLGTNVQAHSMEQFALVSKRGTRLSASTVKKSDLDFRPHRSFIEMPNEVKKAAGGWSPNVNDTEQWIEADFGSDYLIDHLAIQGRFGVAHWVKTFHFRVKAAKDSQFSMIPNPQDGNELVLKGNTDNVAIVMYYFSVPIKARWVRIYPLTWEKCISLRWEVYGCAAR